MTGDNPVSGYQGFEDPEEQYYGTDPTLPVTYTGAWQVRQFGVGGVSTFGTAPSVVDGLANPPTAMTTAADAVLTKQCVTQNDAYRYYPYNAQPTS